MEKAEFYKKFKIYYESLKNSSNSLSDVVMKSISIHQALYEYNKESPYYKRLGELIETGKILISKSPLPSKLKSKDIETVSNIMRLYQEIDHYYSE